MADVVTTGARPVVIFAGGGTGGHLYPALALARALESRTAAEGGVRSYFLGAERGIEARVLPQRGLEHTLLPIRGIHRGGGLARNAGVPWAVLRSLAGALDLFAELRPALVVVTGGYASAPAGLTAVLSGTPLAIQEQNAHPGLVTRLLSRRADQVHVAFPESIEMLPPVAHPRARVSGNPIAPPTPIAPAEARTRLGLDPERPVVLVVGGSQGSVALNRGVAALLTIGLPEGVQLLWGTGLANEDDARAVVAEAGAPADVHLRGYIDDMPAALAAADLAVSRAGAMATSEFLAWGLPAILVPLPSAAADHQHKNAAALAEAGCARLVPEAELDGERLRSELDALLADPALRETMRDACLERARPAAAAEVADALVDLLPNRRAA